MAGTSRNQANKWMTRAETAYAQAVKAQLAPAAELTAEAVFGKRDSGWFEYLKRAVKLDYRIARTPDGRREAAAQVVKPLDPLNSLKP